MQGKQLPAGIDEVAGSLEEAAGYERLALERRKGVLGMVSAFLLVFLVAAKWLGWSLVPDHARGIALTIFLLAATVGLQLFLKRRPAWKPLFEPRQKFTWRGYIVFLLVSTALGAAAGFLLFGLGFSLRTQSALLCFVFGAVLLVMGRSKFSYRHNPLRYSWIGPIVPGLLIATGLLSTDLMIEGMFFGLGGAALLESTYRLFAPRRWLVR